MIPFFVMHYGIFWFVHGVFVLTLPLFGALQRRVGALGRASAAGHDPAGGLALFDQPRPVVLVELPRPRRVPPHVRGGQMFAPYGRLVILHVTIIFGALAISFTGAPAAAVAILVVLKTALDVGLHLASTGTVRAAGRPTVANRGRADAPRAGPRSTGRRGRPASGVARHAASRSASAVVAERQDLRRQQAGVGRRCRWRPSRPGSRAASGRSRAASPCRPRCWVGIGTPMTGRIVLAASMPGQVRGAAGAGDDHPDAAARRPPRRSGTGGRASDGPRRPAARRPRRARSRTVDGRLEDREVRAAAADDPDAGPRGPSRARSSASPSGRSHGPLSRRPGAARARSSRRRRRRPSAVTWPILRRSKTRRLSYRWRWTVGSASASPTPPAPAAPARAARARAG